MMLELTEDERELLERIVNRAEGFMQDQLRRGMKVPENDHKIITQLIFKIRQMNLEKDKND
jgi:hypothetical protein